MIQEADVLAEVWSMASTVQKGLAAAADPGLILSETIVTSLDPWTLGWRYYRGHQRAKGPEGRVGTGRTAINFTTWTLAQGGQGRGT